MLFTFLYIHNIKDNYNLLLLIFSKLSFVTLIFSILNSFVFNCQLKENVLISIRYSESIF
jgi:hypothetical protein